ncbi:MAG: VOC family protein [Anaerolineae bacterium]|nr:VOC family protein [Anaerolineae bacterium]
MAAITPPVVTQIGIVVRDIERTVAAYSRIFGVDAPPVLVTDEYDKAHTIFNGQPTEARAKLAFFQMGQVSIELIEPIGGPSTWRQFLEERGEGVHHIAFQVQDTDGVVRALDAEGIPVEQQGDYTGGRYTYLNSASAVGTILELLENTG